MKVPGIGPSKAKEIIEYKNQKVHLIALMI